MYIQKMENNEGHNKNNKNKSRLLLPLELLFDIIHTANKRQKNRYGKYF
uniref:Uncharacterized protein n=1 Tax=Meloidogyne enterolobii TaxID=390850 RepID=A0A6V7V4B2_MELEN|nr:unnamed protein product [Meloidogyne enterolobii]